MLWSSVTHCLNGMAVTPGQAGAATTAFAIDVNEPSTATFAANHHGAVVITEVQ